MKKLVLCCTLAFFLGLLASPAKAQQGYRGGMDDDSPPRGMMMQQGGGMGMGTGMMGTCPNCPNCPRGMGGGRGRMMGPMHGEMHEMMMGGMGMAKGRGPSFYLNMTDELGLSPQQVQQLRTIRRDFKKDAVRRSADLKIAMIDLGTAFEGDWTVDAAEKQLRQIQAARTDLMVQYLKARKQAEQVLTAEQLQKIRGEMDQDDDL
ncbi:Spy/CpxP family protein refolding chaperone [Desulfuromonas sp. TF]|uniref:Spy/CpxP family protein refolding chaperone n=1 Tax=Desulfuromonas sp. TF TaxID=1232410 RepID=UPI00041DC00F|nr:Spy/CpxP family protein refolding chaperone [Desulfuromonas sp. TF]